MEQSFGLSHFIDFRIEILCSDFSHLELLLSKLWYLIIAHIINSMNLYLPECSKSDVIKAVHAYFISFVVRFCLKANFVD